MRKGVHREVESEGGSRTLREASDDRMSLRIKTKSPLPKVIKSI